MSITETICFQWSLILEFLRRPGDTFRDKIFTGPRGAVNVLACLEGALCILLLCGKYRFFQVVPPGFVVALILLCGPVLGLISVEICATAIAWTADKLGGEYELEKSKAVIAFSAVPLLLACFALFPLNLFIAGTALFPMPPPGGAVPAVLAFVWLAAASAALLWSFILSIKGIKALHGFLVWRSLLTLFALVGVLLFALFFTAFSTILLPL